MSLFKWVWTKFMFLNKSVLTMSQKQDKHTRSTYAAYDIPCFTRYQMDWPIFYQHQGQHISKTNCIHATELLKSARTCYNSFSTFQTNDPQQWKRYWFYNADQCLYMQWTAFLDFLYTNYKLLWRSGNSKLSKCNFSFIYSSVDHSTWLPIKFLHSWVRRNKRAY